MYLCVYVYVWLLISDVCYWICTLKINSSLNVIGLGWRYIYIAVVVFLLCFPHDRGPSSVARGGVCCT